MVENVGSFHSCGPLLLVAEDEVDPVVQAGRHDVALQRGAMHPNEFARVFLGPWREDHVAELDAVLFATWTHKNIRLECSFLARQLPVNLS